MKDEQYFVNWLTVYIYNNKQSKVMQKRVFIAVAAMSISAIANAQLNTSKVSPESTELWNPVPRVVTPGGSGTGSPAATAPSDALVLFDGRDFSKWKSASGKGGDVQWTIADGAFTVKPGTGDIQTKDEFENYQLHIEFRTPSVVKGNGQGRGNSGIFQQGVYELQVLDSYQNPTYSNGQAGSLYKRVMPLVNASRKPGEWQTYDVIWTAPKFNKDSMILAPAYITVLHNGVLIQNHTAVAGTTPYIGAPQNQVHGKGPVKLQDHGDLVSYRNIWIREL
jgi:hypothetical protein